MQRITKRVEDSLAGALELVDDAMSKIENEHHAELVESIEKNDGEFPQKIMINSHIRGMIYIRMIRDALLWSIAYADHRFNQISTQVVKAKD